MWNVRPPSKVKNLEKRERGHNRSEMLTKENWVGTTRKRTATQRKRSPRTGGVDGIQWWRGMLKPKKRNPRQMNRKEPRAHHKDDWKQPKGKEQMRFKDEPGKRSNNRGGTVL